MKVILILLYSLINLLSFSNVESSEAKYIKLTNNVSSKLIDVYNDNINILVKFNYESLNKNDVYITNDKKLNEYRKEVKEYYYNHNELIIEMLDLKNYDYSSSYYSSYAEIMFDNYLEFKKDNYRLIEKLNYSPLVETISINSCFIDESVVSEDYNAPNYSLEKAMNDIGLSSYERTGEGIRVGILELYAPRNVNDDVFEYYERYVDYSTRDTQHSFDVMALIGSKGYGIAKNVHFFCVGSIGKKITDCFNWLVDSKKVNIINVSMGINITNNQNNSIYYNDYCEYVDFVSNNSKVTIIKSAGNDGEDSNQYVSTPGCGLNVITVGASNSRKEVSRLSSWNSKNYGYLYKPDFVAPGEKIRVSNSSNNTLSGTSYAAPMVTGIVALLMEEFTVLKSNPSLVKSVLQAGCNMLDKQESYYDIHCGFGLVNYSNSRNYLLKKQYKEFIISKTQNYNEKIISFDVDIPAFGSFELNANWLILSKSSPIQSGKAIIPIFSKCKILLIDNETGEQCACSMLDGNIGFIKYDNYSNHNKTYKVDLRLYGIKETEDDELGSIVYNVSTHKHEYFYKSIDMNSHKVTCICGKNYISPHVVSAPINPGQRYAICMLCHGRAEMGMIGSLSKTSFPKTINGSYKLPNGVIVLVDEDIESYLSGMLVFDNYDTYF